MNRDDDFTQLLASWLRRRAPAQAPDRVLETALERVAAESQGGTWQQRLFGTTAMGSFVRVAAVAAVIAVAVLVGQQLSNLLPYVGETSPSPSIVAPSPTTSPAADCVNPPIDITSLINMADPVACYGNADLTLDAEVVAGIGGCPIVVEPTWLSCPQTLLMLVGETRKVGASTLSVAIDPASGVSVGAPNKNVRVTGHFDDPAAQTCRETERLEVGGTPAPAKLTIEGCRRTFVVTQVVPLAADRTGTLTWIAGAADGRGLSVSEAIAGAPMEQVLVNGWLLIDGFGRIWLCETISDSSPPRFDAARLLVENYPDSSSPDFLEVDGVRWIPDPVQIFGNVSVP
jgi:hypothetical protein